MDEDGAHRVRLAGPDDARAVGQLLHDFNVEYDDITPGPEALARRVVDLLAADQLTVLVGFTAAGDAPEGLAALRFRPSIWTDGLECYLAELYVIPGRRGHGLGRALVTAALEVARDRGADHIDLGTSENDVAARALYEHLGFTNLEGGPGGPVMYVYEREL